MTETQSSLLEAGTRIGIAQLHPNLDNAPSRVVRGVVTISWPYSIIRQSVAFILAESDFLRRRDKGQVRVEFSGPSAKAVADAGLVGGDEVTLSLDGAAWVERDAATPISGVPLEWQLKFGERLLLSAVKVDTRETKFIDLSHSTSDAVVEPLAEPEPIPSLLNDSPSPASSPLNISPDTTAQPESPKAKPKSLEPGEFASPAFLKRARMSYGSLFEGGLDIFEEDGGAKGRGRKRSRIGRFSSSWRYTSQSPSPERENTEDTQINGSPDVLGHSTPVSLENRQMVDDGCQTVESDTTGPSLLLDHVEPAGQARFSHPAAPSPQVQVRALGHGPQTSPFVMNRHGGGRTGQGQDSTRQPFYGPVFNQQPPPEQGALNRMNPVPAQVPNSSPSTVPPVMELHREPQVMPQVDPAHGGGTFMATPQAFPESMQRTRHSPVGAHFGLEPHHVLDGVNVNQDPHHTVIVNGIAEPKQMIWHHDAPSESYPYPAGEHVQQEAFVGTSFGTQPPMASSAEEQGNALRNSPVVRGFGQDAAEWHHPENPVESDRVPEDHDRTEEAFGSQTYGARHFQPTGGSAETDRPSSDIAADDDDDGDAVGDDDEVEAGGDYDITSYRNLSNIQDDDEGSELESNYDQEEDAEIFDRQGEGDESDQIEEDIENYGNGSPREDYDNDYDEYEDEEEEDEGYSDEYEETGEATAPIRSGPTEVISLLSDSEEEEELEDTKETAPIPPSTHRPKTPTPTPELEPLPTRIAQNDGPADDRYGPSRRDEREAASTTVGQRHGKPRPASRQDSLQSAEGVAMGGTVNFGRPSAADIFELESMSPVRTLPLMAMAHGQDPRSVESQPPFPPSSLSAVSEVLVESAVTTQIGGTRENEVVSRVSDILETQITDFEAVHDDLVTEGPEDSTKVNHTREPDVEMADETAVRDTVAPVEAKEEQPATVDVTMGNANDAVHEPEGGVSSSTATEHAGKFMAPPEGHSLSVSVPRITVDGTAVSVPSAQYTDHQLLPIEKKEEPAEPQTKAADDSTTLDEHNQLPTPANTQQQDSRQLEAAVEIEHVISTSDASPPAVGQPGEELDKESEGDTEKAPEAGKKSSPVATPSPQTRPKGSIRSTRSRHNDGEEQPVTEAVTPSKTVTPPKKIPKSTPSQQEGAELPNEARLPETEPRSTRSRTQHKADKADGPTLDLSNSVAKASQPPRRQSRLVEHATPPDNVRVTRAASHNLQLSASSDVDEDEDEDEDDSVQIAKAALGSPTRSGAQERTGSAEETRSMKHQLMSSLRMDVPDCVSLKVIQSHPGKTVDVMAISTTTPPEPKRAKGGPRGVMLAFHVTDHSIPPTQVVVVHIFRAYQTALPVVQPGDAVLLRQFNVTAMAGHGFGLKATDASSWAVFDGGADDEIPQIRGPPVELSKGDKTFASLLKKWYRGLDGRTAEKLRKAHEVRPWVGGEEMK